MQALKLHLSSSEEEPTLTPVLYGLEDVSAGSPEDEDNITIIVHEAGMKLEAGVSSQDQAVGEVDDANIPDTLSSSLEPVVLVEEEPNAKDDDDDMDIIFVE